MNTGMILDYLQDLSTHNNRDWFKENKSRYEQARSAFIAFSKEWLYQLGKDEPRMLSLEPETLMFRIQRDIRFSKDKTPYIPGFRLHAGPMGKQFIPAGYAFCLMPGNQSVLAGGLHESGWKQATQSMREAIASKGDAFISILNSQTFGQYFHLEGEKLKNVPRDFAPDHPYGEYLKYKSWFVQSVLPDELVRDSQRLMEELLKRCYAIRPFLKFINEALADFHIPERN